MPNQYICFVSALSIAVASQESYASSNLVSSIGSALESIEVSAGRFLNSFSNPPIKEPESNSKDRTQARSKLVPIVANFPTSPDHSPDEPEYSVFVVSSQTELSQALLEAEDGSIIRLAPGHYGNYNFSKARFETGMVSIISEQPDSPAVFSSINLSNSSGLLLGDLHVAGGGRPLVTVSSASNIVLSGMHFSGVTADRDPWDESTTAIWVRGSSQVTIYSNRFSDVRIGIFVQRSHQISILRNELAYIREGLNIAATDRLLIEGNHFHSFSPKYADGEHSDAVQFWTSNETVGSTNVGIKDNYFEFGGSRAVQGIFARSEVAESGKLPTARHADWVVSGNIYFGSSRHGITLSSIDRARVENNIAAASPWADLDGAPESDDEGRSSGGLQPWIRVGNATDSVFRGNAAMLFSSSGQVDVSNNIDIYDPKTKKGVEWTTILKSRPVSDRPPASDLVTYEHSPAAYSGVGVLRLSTFGLSNSLPPRLIAEAVGQHKKHGRD